MQLFITKPFKSSQTLAFIKSSSLVALIFSFLLCISIFVLFIGFQTTVNEAVILFLKTLVVTWVFIVGIKVGFTLLLFMLEKTRRIQLAFISKKYRSIKIMSLLGLVAVWLYSCQGQPLVGISKDLNTGMVTTYSKMKPEESVIVMNEEKLGHTQIPLGEKFVVINNKVKGLVVKDNKVSIGCSLKIIDSDGKALLDEADLFKDGSGVYDQKDAESLKCTVSTGKPMELNKDYKIAVQFWDKYGAGTIENKFTISMIDTP
ncbi:MAG: hypothetical protein ABIN67_00880 [Ferruginibacter sp.]